MFGWLRKTPLSEAQLEEKIQAEIRSRVFKREKAIKREKRRASDAAINIAAMQEMTDIVSDKEVEKIDREVRAQFKKTEKTKTTGHGEEGDLAGAQLEEKIQAEIRSRVFLREQDINKEKQQASKAAINVEVMQEMTSLVPDKEVEKIDREVRAKHKKAKQKRARRISQRGKVLRLVAVWGSVALVLGGIYFHQWVAQTGRARAAYYEVSYRLASPNPSEWFLGIDVNARNGDGMTPLMVEARRPQHLWRLKKTVEKGAEIDAADPAGNTALMWAAREGNVPGLDVLDSAGANLDAEDDKGLTALMWAVEQGQAGSVEMLIKKGADSGLQDKNGKTALMRAAVKGDATIVTLLIKHGASGEVKDRAGKTALMLARETNHGEIAKLIQKETLRRKRKRIVKNARAEMKARGLKLNYAGFMRQVRYRTLKGVRLYLDAGMDPNAATRNRPTALYMAAKIGHTEIVELLIERGAKPDLRPGGRFETALHWAAERGHGRVVQALIRGGAKPNATTRNYSTALILAAGRGHSDIVEFLAKNGADVTHKNRRGTTALIALAASGTPRSIRILLEKGADPNHKNRYGRSALYNARRNRSSTVLQMLLLKGAQIGGDTNKIFDLAIRRGDPKLVALLLKKGLDPNSQDRNARTLLMKAADSGNAEIVTLLAGQGANINAKNRGGYTALHRAISGKNLNVARILLARGARVNSQSKHGVTPLMQAASSGSLEALELLLRQKARIGLREGHGDTALFFAVNKKAANPKVVALLLRKGERVNARTKKGGTPLMFAATYSRGEILGLLLKNGAKVNAKNKQGQTALYQAVRRGREENVRVLLKWRANVHIRTREGVTALMLAKLIYDPRIGELLSARGARLTNNDTIWVVRALRGRDPRRR